MDTTHTFTDVPAGATHADAISCAHHTGLFLGDADGNFRPETFLSRAQMATVLHRALGLLGIDLPAGTTNPYPDTDGGTHHDAIGALTAARILTGHPDGTYRPNVPVTRAQLASMIDRASHQLTPYPDSDHPGFADVTGGPHRKPIERLAAAGIIHGLAPDGYRYGPDQPIRRDQAAALITRWYRDQTQPDPRGPTRSAHHRP